MKEQLDQTANQRKPSQLRSCAKLNLTCHACTHCFKEKSRFISKMLRSLDIRNSTRNNTGVVLS